VQTGWPVTKPEQAGRARGRVGSVCIFHCLPQGHSARLGTLAQCRERDEGRQRGQRQQAGVLHMQLKTMCITTFSLSLGHLSYQDPASSVAAWRWLASAGRLESKGRHSWRQLAQQHRRSGKEVLPHFWKHTLPKILKMVEVVLRAGWWRLYRAAFQDVCWQLGQPDVGASQCTGNHSLLHHETPPGIEADRLLRDWQNWK